MRTREYRKIFLQFVVWRIANAGKICLRQRKTLGAPGCHKRVWYALALRKTAPFSIVGNFRYEQRPTAGDSRAKIREIETHEEDALVVSWKMVFWRLFHARFHETNNYFDIFEQQKEIGFPEFGNVGSESGLFGRKIYCNWWKQSGPRILRKSPEEPFSIFEESSPRNFLSIFLLTKNVI